MTDHSEQVKLAMLSVIRYPWEHGTAMQAIYETGDVRTTVAMAHDAALRQKPDGRLAVINENVAVTDPAASGEGVLRAYEITGKNFYKNAADRMLSYLMYKAPRTNEDVILHNQVSFYEGFTEKQVWVDSLYMMPPFLAVMGEIPEALFQIRGICFYLTDPDTGLLYHIYDAGSKEFVRKKLWATGNGWALLGLMRVLEEADARGFTEERDELLERFHTILTAMLSYQLPDGRFHDILDDPESFADGTSAMMMAASVYRGIAGGYLSAAFRENADRVAVTMEKYVDDYGLIHEVCGCPDFQTSGTSCESMAAYLMMHAWRKKLGDAE